MAEKELTPAIKAASRMWEHTAHQLFSFGPITDEEAARVKKSIGLDLTGFSRFMATRGVRHIKREHSDSVIEAQRFQFAVNPADFALIPEIASRGEVQLIGKSGSRKPIRLEHCATIDDRVYVMIETISKSEKRLELSNMWIKKLETGKI